MDKRVNSDLRLPLVSNNYRLPDGACACNTQLSAILDDGRREVYESSNATLLYMDHLRRHMEYTLACIFSLGCQLFNSYGFYCLHASCIESIDRHRVNLANDRIDSLDRCGKSNS